MKRIIPVLLSLVLLFSALCACGTESAAPETPDNNTQPQSTPAPDAAPSPELNVFPGNGIFSRGVVTNKEYLSSYLGIRFTADENWVFASDAELNELMGLSLDIIGDDVYGENKELMETIAKQSIIYDMVAAAPDGSNVQVILENLQISNNGAPLSENDYADILREQLASLTEFSYKLSDTYSSELAGKSFTVIDAELEGTATHQQFWLLCVDHYMLCITFTAMTESAPDFVSLFSAA